MSELPKFEDSAISLPSLLPLQAAPYSQEQVIPYLQSLHNYLAGDRASVVRALNVLSAYRLLMEEEDMFPAAFGSGTLMVDSAAHGLFYDRDTDDRDAAEWRPIVPSLHGDTQEPTGFPNTNTDTTIGISAGSFFIEPTGASFSFYISGQKFTKTAQETVSLAAATTKGNWYIYYDSTGTLVLDGTVTTEDIIRDNCFVAELYHDGTSISFMFDERHGLMPWQTHLWLHLHEGAVHRSGLGLTGMVVDGDGNTDSHAEMDAATGKFFDEDLEHTLAAMTANWDILYYLSNAWEFESTGANSPVKLSVGVPQYNDVTGAGVLSDVTLNKYFLMHIFGTNLVTNGTGTAVNGHVAIVGQNEYNSKLAARVGATEELGSIVTVGLPTPEFVPIATVIFQRKGSNAYNCAVVSTTEGDDYVSWLGAEIQPGSPPASHPNLTNRDLADQHPGDAISLDTTSFAGMLSASDDEVQSALDTLDDHVHGGAAGPYLPLSAGAGNSITGSLHFDTAGSPGIYLFTSPSTSDQIMTFTTSLITSIEPLRLLTGATAASISFRDNSQTEDWLIGNSGANFGIFQMFGTPTYPLVIEDNSVNNAIRLNQYGTGINRGAASGFDLDIGAIEGTGYATVVRIGDGSEGVSLVLDADTTKLQGIYFRKDGVGDWSFRHTNTEVFRLYDDVNSKTRMQVTHDGAFDIYLPATAGWVNIMNQWGTWMHRFSDLEFIMGCDTTAPTDAEMRNKSLAFYASGTTVSCKFKDYLGTVRTGTVATVA